MDRRREILEGVKDGSIAPDEALRLLEQLEHEGHEPSEPVEPVDPADPADPAEADPAEPDRFQQPRSPAGPAVRLLRVEHELGSVFVRADPSVAQYEVAGPHSVRQEGRTIVITGESFGGGIGFVMGPGERRPHWRWPGKDKRHSVLRVNVNPSIPLDVHLEAGRLQVHGMRAPIKAGVELGTLLVRDFEGPIDLGVESGTITADGLVTGRSGISCELGKVIANLDRNSDVRVSARCQLGSVRMEPRPAMATDDDPSSGSSAVRKAKRGGVGTRGEFEIGNGSGELDIRVECGSIRIGLNE